MYNIPKHFQRLSSAASASYPSQIGCSYWRVEIQTASENQIGAASVCWTCYVCCGLPLAGSAETVAAVFVELEICH